MAEQNIGTVATAHDVISMACFNKITAGAQREIFRTATTDPENISVTANCSLCDLQRYLLYADKCV